MKFISSSIKLCTTVDRFSPDWIKTWKKERTERTTELYDVMLNRTSAVTVKARTDLESAADNYKLCCPQPTITSHSSPRILRRHEESRTRCTRTEGDYKKPATRRKRSRRKDDRRKFTNRRIWSLSRLFPFLACLECSPRLCSKMNLQLCCSNAASSRSSIMRSYSRTSMCEQTNL